MEELFTEGYATNDLARFMPNGKPMGTKEFGNLLISKINQKN
jgi:isocitrate dehydrogenase